MPTQRGVAPKWRHGCLPRSPELVRDYDNLAQCCYIAGAAQAEPTNRRRWLEAAIKYGDMASRLANETLYKDPAIQAGVRATIEQNTRLAKSDLTN